MYVNILLQGISNFVLLIKIYFMNAKFLVQSITAVVIYALPVTAVSQIKTKEKPIQQIDTNQNQKHMEYKVNIGRIDVPAASIPEFKKQSVLTPKYLQTLPGYVTGDYYEMTDESGDLHMISVVTWQNQEAYEKAQKALKKHYEELGFNRMEFVQRLNLKIKHEAFSVLNIN
jgi:hypothetical protein